MKMLFYFLMKSGNLSSINIDPFQVEVSHLKKILALEINSNEDNIILIANGGLCIQDGILGNYNCADNEDNPIFVYLRQQKRVINDAAEDSDLHLEFNNIIEKLKITINKVGYNISILQENESLSAMIIESSKRFNKKLKLEISNQFLVVDGWSAAIANLHDSLTSVEKRIDAMKSNLDRFLNNELETGFQMMEKFHLYKTELERVPLLAALFQASEKSDEEFQHPVNLLQWVLSQDSRTCQKITVQSLISEAHQAYVDLMGISDNIEVNFENIKDQWGKTGLVATAYKNIEIGRSLLEQGKPMQSIIDEDIEEVERVAEKETHTSTKEFLRRLNYLTSVREQCDHLIGLIQTHKEYMEHTVRQCKDSGSHIILQDHCESAKTHLSNVRKHYTCLWENLNKVDRSKNDLTSNIDFRKGWLQKFQTKICEVDDSLFLIKEKIKRVRTGLRVLDQMQSAPSVYARGIAEIARRQHYLDLWYEWGFQWSKLAEEIQKKNAVARNQFTKCLENHFVQTLFSSLYSFSLPRLGTQLLQSTRPTLPVVTEADLQNLANCLPDFKPILIFEKIDLSSLNQGKIPQTHPFSSDAVNAELTSRPFKDEIQKDDVANGMSLLPVPDDLIGNIDELCLSHRVHKVSETAISSDSVSNDSSKMVKSIDSMDFQLTNDAMTETKRDIVCISRSQLESLVHNLRELKSKLNATKSHFSKEISNQGPLYNQIRKLVTDVSEKSTLDNQIMCASKDMVNKTSPTVAKESPNSFQIFHKDFTNGDQVCFVGYVVNGISQWRMISTDNRIYVLNDSSLNTPSISRRNRVESVADQRDSPIIDCPIMAMSQASSQVVSQTNPLNSVPTAMSTLRGTFLSKEEYICKKTSNRYGLPVNTKFFRVQANIDWMSSNRSATSN